MKKLCRSLSLSLPPEGQEENARIVSDREQQFDTLRRKLLTISVSPYCEWNMRIGSCLFM